MQTSVPTKGNLMAARRSRALAENGWELMDRKRSILVRELMGRMEEARQLQGQMETAFAGAYEALAEAEAVSGDCLPQASAVAIEDSLRLRYRSVMGVELPSVTAEARRADVLPYELAESSAALDEAYRRFAAVRELLSKLAETECAVYRLAAAIQKAQKRANALENIVIPALDSDIARISDALEERDREEFTRLKVIKGRK